MISRFVVAARWVGRSDSESSPMLPRGAWGKLGQNRIGSRVESNDIGPKSGTQSDAAQKKRKNNETLLNGTFNCMPKGAVIRKRSSRSNVAFSKQK